MLQYLNLEAEFSIMSEVNIYPSKSNGFIFQVSIVAAWINFQNEYLFLQRNAKFHEAFRWGIPGGKIELKEEPIAALQREIFEETKVNLIKENDYDRKILL